MKTYFSRVVCARLPILLIVPGLIVGAMGTRVRSARRRMWARTNTASRWIGASLCRF